jgi:DNA processing protein
VLAGWCRAVLVAEATFKSGSLITARLALDLGRDVLAVPGPVTSRSSEGTNELIARGARLVRGLPDVVGELLPEEVARLVLPREEGAPPGPTDPLLAGLAPGEAVPLEALAERSGLAPGALLARLVRLESEGRVRALAGGLWSPA